MTADTDVSANDKEFASATVQNAEDADLIRRYVEKGDRDAVNTLFTRHANAAYSLARRFLRGSSDAEDAVQNAFTLVFQNAGKFRHGEGANVKTWILGFVANVCRHHLRDESQRRIRQECIHDFQLIEADKKPDDNQEVTQIIKEAVDKLPDLYRFPVWLRYYEGLSSMDISRVLRVREGTVRMQIARGIEQLRESVATAGYAMSITAVAGALASPCGETAPPALTAALSNIAMHMSPGATSAGSVATSSFSSATPAVGTTVSHTMGVMKVALAALCVTGIAATVAFIAYKKSIGQPNKAIAINDASAVSVVLGEPVVVAESAVGESRWGFFQFPVLSRLPSGELLLCFANNPAAVEFHGGQVPAYTSGDQGKTWRSYEGLNAVAPRGLIAPVYDGEYLCWPAVQGMKVENGKLPKSIGQYGIYNGFTLYPLDCCDDEVKNYMRRIDSMRWNPKTRTWTHESTVWDDSGQVVWACNGYAGRTFLEVPFVKWGNELLIADYRTMYADAKGRVPKAWECSLMVSRDNGRSFKRRATLATARNTSDSMMEPFLTLDVRNELVCVIRRTYEKTAPMYLVRSTDCGFTWSEPQELFTFGVLPRLLLLENGIMALSFGRPGVHLSFSPDGTGRTWTKPVTIIKGDPANLIAQTCGYTSMLALDKNTFLLAYSDFLHKDTSGMIRKAIMVRTVEVKPRETQVAGIQE